MVVRASDHGTPVRTADVDVEITVNRLVVLPVWEENDLPYTATITENRDIRSRFITVDANIPSGQGGVGYAIEGVDPAPRFFRISEETGRIYVIDTDALRQDMGINYLVNVVSNFDQINIKPISSKQYFAALITDLIS